MQLGWSHDSKDVINSSSLACSRHIPCSQFIYLFPKRSIYLEENKYTCILSRQIHLPMFVFSGTSPSAPPILWHGPPVTLHRPWSFGGLHSPVRARGKPCAVTLCCRGCLARVPAGYAHNSAPLRWIGCSLPATLRQKASPPTVLGPLWALPFRRRLGPRHSLPLGKPSNIMSVLFRLAPHLGGDPHSRLTARKDDRWTAWGWVWHLPCLPLGLPLSICSLLLPIHRRPRLALVSLWRAPVVARIFCFRWVSTLSPSLPWCNPLRFASFWNTSKTALALQRKKNIISNGHDHILLHHRDTLSPSFSSNHEYFFKLVNISKIVNIF